MVARVSITATAVLARTPSGVAEELSGGEAPRLSRQRPCATSAKLGNEAGRQEITRIDSCGRRGACAGRAFSSYGSGTVRPVDHQVGQRRSGDRKSTRLNYSH